MRLALLCLCLSLPALAADPVPAKPAGAKPAPAKKKPAKPMFEMPSLGEVPKADGATRARSASDGLGSGTRTAASDATYQVVRVVHAKAFVGASTGNSPVGGVLETVKLKGTPPQTEKFSSVVRVKSAQRIGAPIDVVLLDPSGNTALSASGELTYRGAKSDEAEWVVDWDPSPVRGPGQYQVLIRIAGHPMGTWPLNVVVSDAR